MAPFVQHRIHIDGVALKRRHKYNPTGTNSANVRYVYAVARTKDVERKPALLVEIVNYLLDKPLSALTFRTLADGLAVSTYTLVYHFGTRAELLREIVRAVSERQAFVVATVSGESGDIDTHLDNIRRSWELSISDRSLQLQRLEFEASLIEALLPQ